MSIEHCPPERERERMRDREIEREGWRRRKAEENNEWIKMQ
jgi:hypothetical protein